MNATLENLCTVDVSNKNHVGDIFTASFCGKVLRQDAQDLAVQLNLVDYLDFPHCGVRNSYNKAIADSVRSTKRDVSPYVIVKVSETVDCVDHVVVRRDIIDDSMVDPNTGILLKTADFDVEARIRFHKDLRNKGKSAAECLTFPTNPDHVICRKVLELYNDAAVLYNAEDIRMAVFRAMDKIKAIKILRGNIWFVLARHAKLVRDIVDFITKLGGDNMAFILPQIDSGETSRAIRNMAESTIKDQFATLKEMITNYKEDSVRRSTLDERMKDFATLRETIKLYTEAVQLDLSDLDLGIQSCEDMLVESISKVSSRA